MLFRSILFPDRLGSGTVVPPHVALLLRGAPSPAQAKGLFGYLFATDSAWLLGQNDCALISLLQDIPRPEWVPALGSLNVTRIDPEAAWRIFRSNTDYFSAWGAEQAPAAAPQSQPHAALDLVPQP